METVIKVRHLNFTMVLVLLLVAPLLSMCSKDESGDEEPPNSFGEVSGTVSSDVGNTYPGISVEVLENGFTIVASDITDASGMYQMSRVPVGDYALVVEEPLGSNLSNNSRPISVAEGQKITQDFNFEIKTVNSVVALDPNDPIGEVINENGEVPTGNEPLYTPFRVSDPGAGIPTPITAPDGHHVTLNEWKAARGTAQVSCSDGVTHYKLEFTGLIPNGVYTLWNCILKRPQRPTAKLSFGSDFDGLGALKDSGSNSFVASEQGKAQIELTADAGPLSMFGRQPDCAITESNGFIIVVDYHIDQQTYGATPGPDDQDVGHLLIFY